MSKGRVIPDIVATGTDVTELFHLHLVSDSTGETTQGVVRACMAQFEGVKVLQHLWPMVRNAAEIERVLVGIRENPGAVLFTLVNSKARSAIEHECSALDMPCISVIDPVMDGMGRYFRRKKSGRPGGQHMMNAEYFDRIEAINFVMNHDDGQLAATLNEADIVLVGVSRTSKSPTAIYLANHWGIKAANVPVVPGLTLPPQLFEATRPFCVGLFASADRLIQIRRNRLLTMKQDVESDYTDIEIVKKEVATARKLFAEQGWAVIDVTRRSVEETATTIFQMYQSHSEAGAA